MVSDRLWPKADTPLPWDAGDEYLCSMLDIEATAAACGAFSGENTLGRYR
jgi:hypothetical protein